MSRKEDMPEWIKQTIRGVEADKTKTEEEKKIEILRVLEDQSNC